MSYFDTGGTSYHVLAMRVSYLVYIPRVLHIHVRDGYVFAFAVTCVFFLSYWGGDTECPLQVCLLTGPR